MARFVSREPVGIRRRRSVAAVAVAVALTGTLAACGGGTSRSADEPVSIRLVSDVDTLDPVATTSVAAQQLLMFGYDRLTYLGSDGEVQPSLATDWEAVDQGFRFTLVEGATCADGADVTPTVVASSLQRLADPENSALYGATVFGEGVPTIEPDDANGTVTITTAKPYTEMLLGLAMPWASVICPDGVASPDQLKSGIVGSGPYELSGSESGSSYTMDLREDYSWGPNDFSGDDDGIPSTVVFKPVENDTTAANQLTAEGLDIGVVRGADVDRLKTDDALTSQTALGVGTNVLLFNHDADRVTADPEVRAAIAMAVSREDYAKAEAFGQGVPATSYMADFASGFDEETADLVQPYDLEAARDALEEAGFTYNGDKLEKDGQPVVLDLISWAGQNSGPDYIVSALTDLGFEITNRGGDLSTWANEAVAGNFDITVAAFSPPMPSFVMNTGPLNAIGHFVNPTWSEAVATAPTASTEEEADAAWATAQRTLLEEVDIAPLYGNEWNWFARDGITFEILTGSGLYVDPYSVRVEAATD